MKIEFREISYAELREEVEVFVKKYGISYDQFIERIFQDTDAVADEFERLDPCDGRFEFVKWLQYLDLMGVLPRPNLEDQVWMKSYDCAECKATVWVSDEAA